MSVRIINGDMLQVLPQLAAEGFQAHSCVTDPPYHLASIVKRFGGTNAAPAQHGRDGAYARASKGFMGKTWDGGDIAMRPETWRLVFDCLRPGAFLVAFGGTRTWHRQAVAIEDAGFEIRDTIMWLYASGFPKSHDVSKGIDKARRRDFVFAAIAMGVVLPGRSLADWTKEDHSPGDKWWAEFRAALPADTWTAVERKVIGHAATGSSGWFVSGKGDITAPATHEAARWQSWGTALKPAVEPIILARKPLEGTVAQNVLKHGCGALNIDACRIGTSKAVPVSRSQKRHAHTYNGGWNPDPDGSGGFDPNLGRWPANVIHDGSDEVEAAFAAFGDKSSGGGDKGNKASETQWGGLRKRAWSSAMHQANSGTASRFFYSAKADAADRVGSKHPTVKPTDLMRYLVQLVTAPGGTVLDPFAGTGSTGLAADQLGMNAVLVEQDETYAADARRKVSSDAPLFASVAAE